MKWYLLKTVTELVTKKFLISSFAIIVKLVNYNYVALLLLYF